MAVLLETSLGDLVVDLYLEERPKCSINFLKLCKVKYYNYSLFHSVQRNFIAQTGDPLGTGEGGQSVWGLCKGEDYKFFEAETHPRVKHTKYGALSMVNNGNGRHGSQFFLTLGVNLDNLDGTHTVFGELAEGNDVLDKINESYVDNEGKPFQDIRIYHTVVLEDPFKDPEGLVIPERSPSPPRVITDSNRIGAEEDIDDYKGMTEDQIKELIEAREAKANAQVLEMVGDIPDADAKPPENVLFVCKLNPVTTDEDLEIIFSRFGPILSCEVIRDQKTGDSLQYAFIEFEKEEDCEKAYFKMDNVLIDDRRIHVDFCQSLAKVKGVSRRKYSEEDPAAEESGKKRTKKDGLVAKTKVREDVGSYEMVFGEEEDSGGPGQSSVKSHKESSRPRREDGERQHHGEKAFGGGSHRHRGRDRSRERGHRERDHKDPDRSRSRSRNRRHDRKRSRSRDRKHHHHHKHRDRSRSRDRSRDRHRKR